MNEDILSFRNVSNTNRYASRFRAARVYGIKLSHFDSNWVIEIPVTLRNAGVISSIEGLKDALFDIFNDAFYRNRFMRLYKNLSSHRTHGTPDATTLHNHDKKELRF